MRIVFVFIFAVLWLLGFVFSQQEECRLPSSVDFYAAKRCLESVSFSKTVRDETINILQTVFKNYVYRDLVQDSSSIESPYYISVDIQKSLTELKTREFSSDFEFHTTVQQLFLQLYDPNTRYEIPLCYSSFTYYLPFQITMDANMEFYLEQTSNSEILEEYNKVYPTFSFDFVTQNSAEYYKILEIDKIPVTEYLENGASTISFRGKDHGVRFNDLIKNSFHSRSLRSTMAPQEHSITFTVEDSESNKETIIVSWLASTGINYQSHNFLDVCGYTSTNSERFLRRKVDLDDYDNSKDDFDLILNYHNEKLFISKIDSEIGVLQIISFSENIDENYVSTGHHYSLIFKEMKKRSIRKLIIDTRGVYGNRPCLAFLLAKMISKYVPIDPNPNGDVIESELHRQFFCSYNTYAKKIFWDSGDKSVANIYKNSKRISRGGKSSFYSQKVHTSCYVENSLVEIGEYFDSPHYFEPENLIILSDGTCSGACGSFVSLFRELRLGRIVTHGGLKDIALSIASVKGAEVKSLRKYREELNAATWIQCILCGCKKVDPLPSSAEFWFSWFEFYPYEPLESLYTRSNVNDSIPADWDKPTSDFHLETWDFTSNMWTYTFPYFDVCKDWEVRSNSSCKNVPFAHAIMGNPCVEGQFDTSSCVLKGCSQFYYLNSRRDLCVEMPKEKKPSSFFDDFTSLLLYLPVFIIVVVLLAALLVTIFYIYFKRKKKKDVDHDHDHDQDEEFEMKDDYNEKSALLKTGLINEKTT